MGGLVARRRWSGRGGGAARGRATAVRDAGGLYALLLGRAGWLMSVLRRVVRPEPGLAMSESRSGSRTELGWAGRVSRARKSLVGVLVAVQASGTLLVQERDETSVTSLRSPLRSPLRRPTTLALASTASLPSAGTCLLKLCCTYLLCAPSPECPAERKAETVARRRRTSSSPTDRTLRAPRAPFARPALRTLLLGFPLPASRLVAACASLLGETSSFTVAAHHELSQLCVALLSSPCFSPPH